MDKEKLQPLALRNAVDNRWLYNRQFFDYHEKLLPYVTTSQVHSMENKGIDRNVPVESNLFGLNDDLNRDCLPQGYQILELPPKDRQQRIPHIGNVFWQRTHVLDTIPEDSYETPLDYNNIN